MSDPVRLSPALRAELVEDLARLVVAARRRRLAERTDLLGGTSVDATKTKSSAVIHEGPAR